MSRPTTVLNRVFVESLFRFLFLAEIEEKKEKRSEMMTCVCAPIG